MTNFSSAESDTSQLVWLITGTSSGLGARLVTVALSRGDLVIATARNVKSIENLWPGHEDTLRKLQLDVTAGLSNLEETINKAIELFGRIDVLVNNAGYNVKGITEEVGSVLFKELYETNVFGVIDTTSAMLPHMRQRKSGTIVMIGSRLAWQAEFPYSGRVVYSSSKAALHAVTESLAVELAPFDIRTLLVEPGAFRTEGILVSPIRGPPSKDSPHTCQGYEAHRKEMEKYIGNVTPKGDPMKGMEVLVDVVRGEGKAKGKGWPTYLVIGPGSRETVEGKCKKIMNEMEEWKDVTSNLVFDDE